jgi:hypothetical protein
LKGVWRLSDDKSDQNDFIYKKTWTTNPNADQFENKIKTDEDLLKEYFWLSDMNQEMI